MEIAQIILRDALVVYPVVLGVGLLWSHSRILDVSVDGVVVLAGIACAAAWRTSHSYAISVGAAVACGVLCSSSVHLLVQRLKINSIMAGLAFSVIVYAVSILLIGESLVLPGTSLLPGFRLIPAWLPLLAAAMFFLSHVLAYTRVGMEIRALGSNPLFRTAHSEDSLRLIAYACSGALYGCGAGIYVHGQGLARSGGGFEFLVFSLCAYLSFDRGFAFLESMIWRVRGSRRGSRSVSSLARHAVGAVTGPACRALLGAVLFQAIVFLSILWAPHPSYWKLIMASVLLIALADMRCEFRVHKRVVPGPPRVGIEAEPGSLIIRDLCKSYDIGAEQRTVFAAATCSFHMGVSIVRGPNGSGKSTLLHIIAGNVAAEAGAITLDGEVLSTLRRSARPVFLMHQNPFQTLAPDLPIVENLTLAAAANNGSAASFPSAERTLDALFARLSTLGVEPLYPRMAEAWFKPAAALSGGEAEVVGLYMASLTGAKVLLIDEPSTGLDALNLSRLMLLIKALAKERIVVLTTHDDRLDVLARRRYVIEHQCIPFEGGKSNHELPARSSTAPGAEFHST
jgi:putative ABC transport system ATP-binding protein